MNTLLAIVIFAMTIIITFSFIKYKKQIINDKLWRMILYYLILIPAILLLPILGSYIIGVVLIGALIYAFFMLGEAVTGQDWGFGSNILEVISIGLYIIITFGVIFGIATIGVLIKRRNKEE